MSAAEIQEEKQRLRRHYRRVRAEIDARDRTLFDRSMCEHLTADRLWREARLLLPYVSTKNEAGTRDLILRALRDGKTVAVPYCIADSGRMEFYRIHSLDELVPRTHGILEPDPRRCERITRFDGALMPVPGLAFDRNGTRLGQGGGYYDRFLAQHAECVTIGLCYEICLCDTLPHAAHDMRCDRVLTERGFVS